jgi:hypothetical protein
MNINRSSTQIARGGIQSQISAVQRMLQYTNNITAEVIKVWKISGINIYSQGYKYM